ncbi:GNAT family N-acetyltransferase [Pseudarthrobacter sp. J1738]|uniref:GNAT family N-acetyltransferase n=1 Tax=Pseudarthrobacter sp. J1738 TaxID=3420446 RepID=UPI003D29C887
MSVQFYFSADESKIDRATVHRWLSEEAYWALGRERATQEAAMDASRNFGVYNAETGVQLAYARVVTDGVTFAWLCDVFVATEARGEGVGVALIDGVVAELDPLNLKRMLLTTATAQGLYSKFGFDVVDVPENWMQRLRPAG